MRVFTDGERHIVVRKGGVEVHTAAGKPAMLHSLEKPIKEEWPRRDVLAVLSREPLHAWAGHDERVRLLRVDAEPNARPVPAHVLEATTLEDGRVLACIGPSREEVDAAGDKPVPARLVVVNGEAETFRAASVKIPKPTRITWPGGIWDPDTVPWPEDEADEDAPVPLDVLAVATLRRGGGLSFDPVHAHSNEHGIAIAGAYAGLVLGVSPDGKHVDFALRVPTQGSDTEIFAARTAEGVVVVICNERHESAVLHLSPEGRVLAHRDKVGKEPAWGMGPPVVHGDRVTLFEAGADGGNKMLDLAIADLKVVKTAEMPAGATGRLSIARAPGSSTILFGLGNDAILVERGGRGRLLVRKLDAPIPPPTAMPTGPKLAEGAPSLAFVKQRAARTWDTSVGAPLSIEIPFTNHGGKCNGIVVEVGGSALTDALVRPGRVCVGEQEAPLVMRGSVAVAEMPGVALVAGYSWERGPKAPPKVMPRPQDTPAQLARIELAGAQVGSGVLTVRLSPLGLPPGRGSVLQGKPLAVSEAPAK